MTYWNYRLIEDKAGGFNIHEVYYNNEDKPHMWAPQPSPVYAETKKEMKSVLKMMKRALKKPPLYIKGDCIVEEK